MDARTLIEQETGVKPGIGYELSFDELGESPKTLSKRAGKVGFRTSLTEFFKAAKRKARAQNPIAPNQADIVKWIIYDRFRFAAGTTVPNNYKYFTQPIGTNGKTKVDTNLDQVQRLPDPLWFNTEGMGFYFSPDNALADITNFINSEFQEFWVGQKVYVEGPVQCFPGGVGIFGASGSYWPGGSGSFTAGEGTAGFSFQFQYYYQTSGSMPLLRQIPYSYPSVFVPNFSIPR